MDLVTQSIIDGIDRNRPLIISDADEVLLQFIVTLEVWLINNDYIVDFKTFSLTDSIKNKATMRTVSQHEMGYILDRFFEEKVEDIPAVNGAVEALSDLSETAQIIILTNVPARHRERRYKALRRLGMDYPVIANDGSKGPMVKSLASGHKAPIAFIDDLPPHHTAVAEAAGHIHRLHFVADSRLAAKIGKADAAHARHDTWAQAKDWLSDVLVLTSPRS